MTDITITCYADHKYAVIRNTGTNGRSVAVAKFLQGLAKRGAFVTLSDGPMASSHGLENRRIEGFIAYAAEEGFVAA
jgi:hypothetical protein